MAAFSSAIELAEEARDDRPFSRVVWSESAFMNPRRSLIMATEPLIAVLMLGRLGFAPWQYGLAFAAPCVGGLIGSRLARRIVAGFGQHKVVLIAGTLRAVWLLGLAFIRPGVAGLVLVMAVELGLIISCSVFNPVFATYRLERTPPTESPALCPPGRSAAAPPSRP